MHRWVRSRARRRSSRISPRPSFREALSPWRSDPICASVRPRSAFVASIIRSARVSSAAAVSTVRSQCREFIEEYARAVPALGLGFASSAATPDVEVRLIDEKDFQSALQEAFGPKVARDFVSRTDPQCMTSVKSTADGKIVHSVSFIIVDKGEDVFLDCAYHELLHAFGLSNHDQRNPWTTLNQNRMVGYLTVYDRSLLTLLYDPRIRPGMTARQVRAVLPQIIADKGLGSANR